MPELPEVETIRLSLADQIMGATIRSVRINHPDVILYPSRNAWAPALQGAHLAGIGRRGKFLLARWQRHAAAPERPVAADLDLIMLVHLRMTGRLVVTLTGAPLVKHTHVQFGLAGGRELRFIDPRRFGRIALVPLPLLGPLAGEAGLDGPPGATGAAAPDKKEATAGARGQEHSAADAAARGARAALPPGLWQLGPEPLSAHFTAHYLTTALAGRRASVKARLLDQRLVAGLGNIYVDEALFRARIHPATAAGRVDGAAIKRLHRAIRDVLREGITHRGTTLADYRDAAGEPGAMAARLLVFRREGEPCSQCGTPLAKMRLAGRGTHFCPHCQPAPTA